jgi:hypothetical protein
VEHPRQESDRPFDPDSLPLRKERVDTEAGVLWVWELMAGETALIAEYATRPDIDPRGGMDKGEAMVWYMALSCHKGEADNSPRFWPDTDVWKINRLPERIFKPLWKAVQRVNGMSVTEEEALRDFTTATGAPVSSG